MIMQSMKNRSNSTQFADESLIALDQQLCFMLYSASRAMTKAYQPMLKDLQITYPQYLVLMVMWEWDREGYEEPTVNALGARLFLDSGTLTPLLKRMEKQGLVKRQRNPCDERQVLLGLTDSGISLKERALQWVKKSVDTAGTKLEGISELREQLKAFMYTIKDTYL